MSILSLFLLVLPSLTSTTQPDLPSLFSGTTNCDLYFVRDIKHPCDISFPAFLPIVSIPRGIRMRFGFGFGLYFYTTRIRAPPCRIIYAGDYSALRYSLFGVPAPFTLNPYRFRDPEAWISYQPVTSMENVFVLAFLNDTVSYDVKRTIARHHLTLGLVKIGKDAKHEICWLDSSSCTSVEGENTALKILENGRHPPRKWYTEGINLELSRDFFLSDIITLRQSSNPMDRLGHMVSVPLHHAQAVFRKANASLMWDPFGIGYSPNHLGIAQIPLLILG